MVTNSADRILRHFTLPVYAPPSIDGSYIEQELEPTYRFSDPINRVAWYTMSYSPDGEFLAGGMLLFLSMMFSDTSAVRDRCGSTLR